jgi:hypothetical protein
MPKSGRSQASGLILFKAGKTSSDVVSPLDGYVGAEPNAFEKPPVIPRSEDAAANKIREVYLSLSTVIVADPDAKCGRAFTSVGHHGADATPCSRRGRD